MINDFVDGVKLVGVDIKIYDKNFVAIITYFDKI